MQFGAFVEFAPNKDGMISMLLSVMQAPIRGLACAIKAVSEKE